MREGEEAIVERVEREKEEAEAFARTLRPSKGSQEKSDVSIKLYVKQEKTAKGCRVKYIKLNFFIHVLIQFYLNVFYSST